MSQGLPDNIARIRPYVPGRNEEDVEAGPGAAPPLKLASNENPLGPSPLALEAARSALAQCHRYPDGSGRRLRAALAEKFRLPEEQIILGNGSTELVELLARTFLGREGWAVMAQHTFVMYRIAVQSVNGNAREVPLRAMRHDLEAMSAAACAPATVLVYIANPDNPTGTYVTSAEMERYFSTIPEKVITVLDEAYAEFMEREDYPSGVELLRGGKRVVVLRTFSKAYGLAGLRLGFGLAPADLISGMERVRSPFNTSRVAQAAGLAALGDAEHVARSRGVVAQGREFLESELRRRGLSFVPSVTNFILLDAARSAQEVHRALMARGVIARPLGPYGLPTCLRVSVGTPAENARFLQALDAALGQSGQERS
jgi:histidinol-phosphate aminotransferase